MSHEVQHLENAPIKEAIVDIQVELPSNALSNLDKLKKLYSKDFPIAKDLLGLEVRIKNTADTRGSSHEMNRMGIRFETGNNDRVVLARLDRMVFSRVNKYYDWDDLIENAKKAWGKYRRAMKPVRIKRLAVRYINQIHLEWPIEDIVTVQPSIPTGVDYKMNGFTSQTLLTENGVSILVTLAKKDKSEPVLIDIDVFKDVDLLPKQFSSIWKQLHKYREFKNNVFFNYSTEKLIKELG